MKSSYINTQKKIISNGVSFPVDTGQTSPVYYSNSTGYSHQFKNYTSTKKDNLYSICIDWLQFVCTSKDSTRLFLSHSEDRRVYAEKITVHMNPNFNLLHRIFVDGNEVAEIFSEPNNPIFRHSEVMVKISNPILYQDDWCSIIKIVMSNYGLDFIRVSRLDIALDGESNQKIIDLLNKYTKSHTIQIGNDTLKIRGREFCKKELRWISLSIGKVKSGMSATVYDKSKEILESGKNYINDFWIQNGIESDKVIRFEIQLTKNHLKKCNIKNLETLSSGEYLCSILKNKVQPWLRFYSVRKMDVLNSRKEYAIKNGREIRYIKWNHLPYNTMLLPKFNYVSNSTYINARNFISFSLKEICRTPTTSHDDEIKVIIDYAERYQLQEYLTNKIRLVFGSNPDSLYNGTISKLLESPGEIPQQDF